MLKEKIISAGSRMLLKVKKYSPEILLIGAAGAGAAALYFAVKGTIKYKDEIEPEFLDEVEAIKAEALENGNSEEETEAAIKDAKVHCAKMMAKAALPSAGFAFISLILMLASHGIIRKREAGAMAAYEALNKVYSAVKETEGEDSQIKETAETISNPEKSKDKILPILTNPYARIFEEGASDAWQPSKGYNEMFLRQMENWCNEQLDIQGHLFVNDIYDGLRLPRTSAGAVAGYLKEDGVRVDFGIFKPSDKMNPRVRAFLDPLDPENNVVINLNVPGLIWDRI